MIEPTIPVVNRKTIRPLWTEPPGGILVWLIVVLELLTFGMGLAVFLIQGGQHVEVFKQGQSLLNQSIGFANTLILLTGGLFMANVIDRLRVGSIKEAEGWLVAAICSGLMFLLLKGAEYADKLQHGLGLHSDTFYTLYWLLTGFHFIHVMVAIVILLFMWRGIRAGYYHKRQHDDVESSAVFWHMCDLIWLLIYPVLYLLN